MNSPPFKVVCLGTRLGGAAGHPAELARSQVPKGERVIVVSHGTPDKESLEGLEFQALLVVQTSDPAQVKRVAALSREFPERRIFGLAAGWQSISKEDWRAIRDFLESDAERPDSQHLRRLLGLDAPYRLVSLQVALRVALEVLDPAAGPSSGGWRLPGRAPGPEALLAPALKLARGTPAEPIVASIGEDLRAPENRSQVIEQIQAALAAIRSGHEEKARP